MAQDSDPVGSRLVASLAHPGGSITGLSRVSPQLSGKQLELLKEAVPTLTHLAVFENSAQPGNRQSLKEVELAAGPMGVQFETFDIKASEDIQRAFLAASKGRANGLLVLSSPILFARRPEIVQLAAKNRLPATYFALEFAEDGGLICYGPSITDAYRWVGIYAGQILKTAKVLGVNVPPTLLARADEVIEYPAPRAAVQGVPGSSRNSRAYSRAIEAKIEGWA